ncbi:MAG: FtsQ-type POTRA domain-containing protein [Candidatus Saganbacteria bacterium]|nr:FtsQ-type POTRA domain-containing protein [Candidatus Saganbacteria bacterium]
MKKKRKSRKPRKHRRPRFWLTLVIILGVIGLGIYISTLPIWEIKDVVVNGTSMLAEGEIRGLAAIPLRQNLFYTSFSRTRANLSKITAIESFSLYRIPPATVLISISERKPIAIIVFANKSVVIDKDGYIINRNANISLNIPNRADLPVVSGIKESKVLGSDRINQEVSGIVSDIILKLSPYLESSKMQLELGGLQNVSFLLDDLLRVKVGKAENIKRKMEVFDALLPKISGKWDKVAYVDVRYPENPVIRYK